MKGEQNNFKQISVCRRKNERALKEMEARSDNSREVKIVSL